MIRRKHAIRNQMLTLHILDISPRNYSSEITLYGEETYKYGSLLHSDDFVGFHPIKLGNEENSQSLNR